MTVDGDEDDWFEGRLREAQQGHQEAFADLVRWLEHPLLSFVTARGSESPDVTVNEVLVRVFRHVGGFDGGRVQFRAWVFRIARNVLVDEHRRRSAGPAMVVVGPEVLSGVVTVEDELDRVGERERVEAMLACLTDEQREVLLLRVVAGLSVEEVAESMERRPGAVRSLQHRALTRLRTSLTEGSVTR